ncbi:MAG: site-specific integrase [Phycisphaeraceae bacterium]|nr:site-specific integrase [Phycisphaeraceae bacterium]
MSGKQRRTSTHKRLENASKEGVLRARTCDLLVPKAQVAGSSTKARGRAKVPAYRARPEYRQAVVTLTDSRSGARRDYWLGEIGSPESRERYYRALAAWESGGRVLPTFEECGLVPTFHAMKRRRAAAHESGEGGAAGSVAAAILIYWQEVRETVSPKRANAIKVTLRLLRMTDGSTALKDYGPNRLRLLRERMRSGDATSNPPREPWSRRTTNERVRIVQAFFRWAASRELVNESVARALGMEDPIKRRRGEADDRRKVLPVPQDLLDATLPHCSRQVRALIELQLLTGARPGELVGLRAIDIRTDGGDGGEGVWVFEPQDHKNAHRGHTRVILFGPRAQEILRPFMSSRPVDAPLFSPREAEEERRRAAHEARRTPKGYGNGPGTNRSRAPRRPPGDAYDVGSYRRAIWRACDAAFPLPKELRKKRFETAEAWRERVGDEGAAAAARWRGEHRWNPHQLRHTAATRIRKEHGLEAASLILGHASAVVTDAIYAERDLGTAARVARAYG